ncbi:hypothetical protein BVRB_6g141880 [Beta vulgaris subsp. vulgaris]|nr:hypothetical protein BVRB_6g141880 [Beta vulgaris subsp. vulgaris]
MATVGPCLAEVYVLWKMEKEKTEEMRRKKIVKETTTTSSTTADESSTSRNCSASQGGCFSWIQKKIHPSSLPSTK